MELKERTRVYQPHDIKAMFGISINSVYRELQSGRMPHMRIGKKYLIDEADIQAWKSTKKAIALEEGLKPKGKIKPYIKKTLSPAEFCDQWIKRKK
ncbi:MAG: helix-turn-helix domain-containing protein [Cyclobacteriaceae bacterium]